MDDPEFAHLLRALLGDELAGWVLASSQGAIGALSGLANRLDPVTAAAFLAGAAAVASGARLALAGALLVVGAELATALNFIGGVPAWMGALAITLLLLGALQGLLTVVLGEQGAASVLAAILIGGALWLVWHGPARLLRLLAGIAVRVAARRP